MNRDDARAEVLTWLDGELSYVQSKWGQERPEVDRQLEVDGGVRFTDDVDMYLHRAGVLGLGTPRGRQALLKGLSTLVEFCVSTRLVFGELPTPGVTSGEIG